MKEFYITDDGIRLHAKLEMPEGREKCPLVILIHGFTGHMEEPHILAAAGAVTAAGAACLRVEMYGHGKSDGRFEDHTLLKWITNAMTVTDYAKQLDFATDLIICGHSQGGLLAMLAAGMRPDDFKALIPLSPALLIPEGARKGELLGTRFDPEHVPDLVSTEDHTLNGNYVRAAQLLYPEKVIPAYRGPVLIVHGEEDETVPFGDSVRAAAWYENAQLAAIPGDTHCFDYHVESMAEAVKEFVEKITSEF